MQSTCEKNGLFFCVYLLVQVSLAARFPYMVSIDSDEKINGVEISAANHKEVELR